MLAEAKNAAAAKTTKIWCLPVSAQIKPQKISEKPGKLVHIRQFFIAVGHSPTAVRQPVGHAAKAQALNYRVFFI